MKRILACLTVGRCDYGILRPLLKQIADDSSFHLDLISSSVHESRAFGRTADEIKADGFNPVARIRNIPPADTPAGLTTAMTRVTQDMARYLATRKPDLLILLGDRYDTFAAATAAVPAGIPIAHLHGGEITEGAIDEQFRHAITKLSHLHFVSTRDSARRVIRMGEDPRRVITCGAPGLDNLRLVQPLTRARLAQLLGLSLDTPPLLVTLHPATLDWRHAGPQADAFLKALDRMALPVIFTAPNTDPGSDAIRQRMDRFVRSHPHTARLVESLGTRVYFSLMRHAAAMAGNSSSGILEAASFRLPVVNIGDRQKGRHHGRNVLDVPCETAAITAALRRAVSPAFHDSLRSLRNPYGDGRASARILAALKRTDFAALRTKHFSDSGRVQ